MSKLREILNEAHEVEPIVERADGVKVVSYEDAVLLQQEQLLDPTIDMGDREINPDGTIAKSNYKFLAINEDRRLRNYYRVIGKKGGGKVLQVVTDYRAVKEHDSGQVYVSNVTAHELERVDETLVFRRNVKITDDEFIRDFNKSLNKQAMKEVLLAIAANTEENVDDDEMPI